MSIPATRIGTLPTRLYSCEFALPGKWTCILETDEFMGSTATLDETLLPEVGGNSKWIKTKKEIVRQDAHIGIYHHTYERSVTIPPTTTADNRAKDLQNCVVSVGVTLTRAPIGMHPRFTDIQKKYKGVLLYGEWDWPQQDPTGQSTARGTYKNGDTIQNVNPMYGVQEYLVPSITLRQNLIDNSLYSTPTLSSDFGFISQPPRALTDLLGYTSQNPPVSASGAAAGAPWLLMENNSSQHGSDLEITKGWIWGGPGGWNKIIYSQNSPTT